MKDILRNEMNAQRVALEQLIDEHDLSTVLFVIEAICHDKADHLRSNWHDNERARVWERDAKRVAKLAAQTES